MSTRPAPAWLLPERLPAPLADAAAAYAAAGVAVFPCVPGEKRPLTVHGFHDATTDLTQIREWWGRWPDANIGIPTGITVDVLDIDVHAAGNGFPLLRTLQREGLVSGWGQAVRSPSGGLHLYYPADLERPAGSWSRGTAHIDFRGTGGYIIAPPSRITTRTGTQVAYRVMARGKAPRPVAANTIRELLTPKPTRAPVRTVGDPSAWEAAGRLSAWVATLPEGNRNAGLFWAACRIAEAGATEVDTLVALEPAARMAGLPEREITATIRSAHRTTQVVYDPGEHTTLRAGFRPGVVR